MANGDYTAPVEDYAFLLGEVFGTDIIERSTDGAMSAQDMRDVIEAAGEMASEVFAPLDRSGDIEGARLVDGNVLTPQGFTQAYKTYAEAGWMGATSPESAGGDGLPSAVQNALSELWSAANSSLSLAPGLSAGAINTINTYGTQELKDTYLPKLVSGEWTGTMNLTEPQAGTDLGAITTIARDNGDGTYAISGQKIFITWGDHDVADNIIHLVLARTEGAPEGHRGLSLFVAPKYLLNDDGTPGERNSIVTVGLEDKLGIHASPTCQLQYENATGYLVGELNQGLQGMFVMMNDSRINIGIQGLGIADRAYQRAKEYAEFRVQGPVFDRPEGTTIHEHPDVRRLLLSMSSTIHAIRALSVLVGDLRDRGDEDDNRTLMEFLVPLLKSWATEESVRIASDALQVHGGMGFIEETGVAQHYRDARITPIYEGTTAIQSNDLVGRKVLRDQGATLQRLFGMIQEQATHLQGLDHEVATRTAERLGRALASAAAAATALGNFAQSPRDAFAVSVPFQKLLSLLVGGWMHALITGAVLKHDTLSDTDAMRLREADFFGAHHLSEVHALREIVEQGEIA